MTSMQAPNVDFTGVLPTKQRIVFKQTTYLTVTKGAGNAIITNMDSQKVVFGKIKVVILDSYVKTNINLRRFSL